MDSLPAAVANVASGLAALPDAAAVVLGGSRATGAHRPASDWDLGVYYRGAFDADGVRRLGHAGYVSEPGEWGPIMNGGAWLTVDGIAVDVLFRDLDMVERWRDEAEQGRFEVLAQNGYVVGAPTYVPVGELAINRPLSGELPRPEYPDALAEAAAERWRGRAAVSLMFAHIHARADDAVCCTGMLAGAVLCDGARAARRAARVGAEREAPRRARGPRAGAAAAGRAGRRHRRRARGDARSRAAPLALGLRRQRACEAHAARNPCAEPALARELGRIHEDPALHASPAHLHRGRPRALECGVDAGLTHAHEQAAARRDRDGEVPPDEERQPTEHALLAHAVLGGEQVAHALGQTLVVGHAEKLARTPRCTRGLEFSSLTRELRRLAEVDKVDAVPWVAVRPPAIRSAR